MRLGRMLGLYMHVNRIGVRELARDIGVAPATITRITQGEDCKASNVAKLLAWLIEDDDSDG